MHKKAVLPAGCVITLISNMCQESDSSRQARGEPGLCSRGTEAEEATDPHSSISASIRGDDGKTQTQRRKESSEFLPNALKMSTFPGRSGDAICVFNCRCVGCEIWACGDLIQLSPPLLAPVSRPSPTLLDSITACVSTATGGRRRRQQFLFSLLLIAPWPPTKKHFQTQTYIR